MAVSRPSVASAGIGGVASDPNPVEKPVRRRLHPAVPEGSNRLGDETLRFLPPALPEHDLRQREATPGTVRAQPEAIREFYCLVCVLLGLLEVRLPIANGFSGAGERERTQCADAGEARGIFAETALGEVSGLGEVAELEVAAGEPGERRRRVGIMLGNLLETAHGLEGNSPQKVGRSRPHSCLRQRPSLVATRFGRGPTASGRSKRAIRIPAEDVHLRGQHEDEGSGDL